MMDQYLNSKEVISLILLEDYKRSSHIKLNEEYSFGIRNRLNKDKYIKYLMNLRIIRLIYFYMNNNNLLLWCYYIVIFVLVIVNELR